MTRPVSEATLFAGFCGAVVVALVVVYLAARRWLP